MYQLLSKRRKSIIATDSPGGAFALAGKVAVAAEPPGGEIVLESVAHSSSSYPGEWTLPNDIQAGDLLLAFVGWENDTPETIDGFTVVEQYGGEWNWWSLQYRIATGDESSPIAADPSWAPPISHIMRFSGVDNGNPINTWGAYESQAGGSAPSKSVELDSISPDADGTLLVVCSYGAAGNAPTGHTCNAAEPTWSGGVDSTNELAVWTEALASSGATGTRTVVYTAAPTYSLTAMMIALNPA
jgi:hypothetical protein